MNTSLVGFAKRLGLSLALLCALGGCAVYGPPPGAVVGTDANGQPIYAAPYSYPAYYAGYPYYPYYYDPVYIGGGPFFFGYGYHHWGGWGGRGHAGGHGSGHWGGHHH
jgi:hypothetical protein